MANIIIYLKPSCPYCVSALHLFDKKGQKPHIIDITNNDELKEEMIRKTNRYTVPQIFIGNMHVGGCDDLYALEDDGKLDNLLNKIA